jgi:hypothetical protein
MTRSIVARSSLAMSRRSRSSTSVCLRGLAPRSAGAVNVRLAPAPEAATAERPTDTKYSGVSVTAPRRSLARGVGPVSEIIPHGHRDGGEGGLRRGTGGGVEPAQKLSEEVLKANAEIGMEHRSPHRAGASRMRISSLEVTTPDESCLPSVVNHVASYRYVFLFGSAIGTRQTSSSEPVL